MSLNQTALVPVSQSAHGVDFFNPDQFALAQRIANLFAASDIVPESYKGKIGNCVIALDIAARTGSSPMMVMQNLHLIHGKPSWSSPYIIAAVNSLGRYTPLRYELTDLGEIEHYGRKLRNLQCIAYAWEKTVEVADRAKENRLESAPVTVAMAISEGWWEKKGSKWPSMTQLMLQYRAATWFGRMYASEVLMGMQTKEEHIDIESVELPDPAAEKLAERIGLPETASNPAPVASTASTESEKKPRAKKGAAAAQQAAVDIPTQAPTPTPEPSPEPTVEPAPTPAPAPAEKTADVPQPNTPQPTPTPAPTPAPAPAPTQTPAPTPKPPVSEPVIQDASATGRFEVIEAVKVNANSAGTLIWTQVTLSGGAAPAFYQSEPSRFAPVGAIVDLWITERESQRNPGTKIRFITRYEVIGG